MNAIAAIVACFFLPGVIVQAPTPSDDPPPIVLVENLDPEAWRRDPAWILQLHVDRDILKMSVSYTGGCARHRFDLVASSRFLESEPPKVDALLAHDAGSDACPTLIAEDLAFDLTPLRDHYRETYRRDSGTVILILRGTEISYSF
jgi:hypothetical protein